MNGRLGESFPMKFGWMFSSNNGVVRKYAGRYGELLQLQLNHCDIYLMSEKATVRDAGKRRRLSVQHGAGRDDVHYEKFNKKPADVHGVG